MRRLISDAAIETGLGIAWTALCGAGGLWCAAALIVGSVEMAQKIAGWF